jgi:hypothetical protein
MASATRPPEKAVLNAGQLEGWGLIDGAKYHMVCKRAASRNSPVDTSAADMQKPGGVQENRVTRNEENLSPEGNVVVMVNGTCPPDMAGCPV